MPLVGCPGRFREPSSMVVSHAWTPELVLVFSTHLRGSGEAILEPRHSHAAFSPGLIAPVAVVATRCQGREMLMSRWTSNSGQTHPFGGVGVGRFITITCERLQLLHFYWQSPITLPSEIQGGIQGCVYLATILFQVVFKVACQWSEPAPGTWRRWSRGRGAGPAVQRGWHRAPESQKPHKSRKAPQAAAQASHMAFTSTLYHPLKIYMWVI